MTRAKRPLEDIEEKYKTVPENMQHFDSRGSRWANPSWIMEGLDEIMGIRGAYWAVEFSKEEVIDAGGGEKICFVKAEISKLISDRANKYTGVGYGCAVLVERNGAGYIKCLDAWRVAQAKALTEAARFFGIGLSMEKPETRPAAAAPEKKVGGKEEALADLRAAVKAHGYGKIILKIVQHKYGTERVESLPPGLLGDLTDNLDKYYQEWQDAVKKEAAAHGNNKRKDT